MFNKKITLVDSLIKRAKTHSNEVAYKFITENSTQQITYAKLDTKARSVAAWLQLHKAKSDRAMLLLPPGLDYISAFLGCLYAGVIAVPAYPPRKSHHMERLQSIIEDANARFILSTKDILARNSFINKEVLIIEELDNNLSKKWRKETISLEDLAFLQYTSGSTGQPKGVMVTHNNIISNIEAINSISKTKNNKICSWLPPYHDMGLVAGIILPLYYGFPSILMPPTYFTQQSMRFLEIMSREKVTQSPAPNFAYDLCVEAIKNNQLANIDLSNWKVAFNGAEPISVKTIEKFNTTFAVYGLNPLTICPCYGMAEATLMLTSSDCNSNVKVKNVDKIALEQGKIIERNNYTGKSSNVKLVGCGYSALKSEIIIVNPKTKKCCQINIVGEIWAKGPNIAKGYWNKPALTKKVFKAKLRGSNEETYLRTGDLGFLDESGQLFVTGRIKDLIIIQGRNIYPQDIEISVSESHADLITHGGAAFSIYLENNEHLVVVQEVKRHAKNYNEIFESVINSLLENHEIVPYKIVLIRQASLPKTSSGKVQRNYCRQLLLEDKLTILEVWEQKFSKEKGYVAPRNKIEEYFCHIWAELLKLEKDRIGVRDNFFKLGGHSLNATQIFSRIRGKYNIEIPFKLLFEEPTIEKLSKALEAILRKINRNKNSLVPLLKKIENGGSKIPLSYAQQRLWFLEALLPVSLYNIPIIVRFKGKLDTNLLVRAFKKVIERHEILRTVFRKGDDGTTYQVILKDIEAIEVINISNKVDQEKLIEKYKEEEIHKKFNLEQGPLISIKILILDKQDYILLLTMHHIITDAWSVGILKNEVSKLYNSYITGEEIELDDLKIQYSDYSIWQREWLRGEALEKQLVYWKNKLDGIIDVINLPNDRVRPKELSYEGRRYSHKLNKTLSDKLREVARVEGVSLYMVLLSALQVLLHKLSGDEDIVVGSPIANRHYIEVENLIGYFANTIVMRGKVNSEKHFKKLLQEVKADTLESHNYQDIPFEQLVDSIGVERQLNINPIFQILFVMQNANGVNNYIRLNGVNTEYEASEYRVSKFDMQIEVYETDNDGIRIAIGYMKDLYNLDTIERFGNYYSNILTRIVEDIDVKVKDINILSEEERNQIISWNNTKVRYKEDKLVHELFEDRAEKYPDKIAIIYKENQITYEELNLRSNQLAMYLRKVGIKGEDLIGISVEKSIEMVIGILGILKAGGGYVPLDPDYPAERIKFMIEDSQINILLTHSMLKDKFTDYDVRIIELDDNKIISKENTKNLVRNINGNNIADLIYTSGTTGNPKGILTLHKNLVNRIIWLHSFKYNAFEKRCSIANFAFIDFYWEIFTSFFQSATCVLFVRDEILDPNFINNLSNHQITTISVTPSLLKTCLHNLDSNNELTNYITDWQVSGEYCNRSIIKEFFSKFSNLDLLNRYGSTEALSGIMIKFSNTLDINCNYVSKKYQCFNTGIYVLNSNLDLLPVGVVGEIYIGGEGLARGYIGRPDLTAEKFIANPFVTEEEVKEGRNIRIYKTGDLGRYLFDGNIEFIGRADDQIKIRGFRVELGEIESLLREHENIADCIVTSCIINGDDNGLVAYIVPVEEEKNKLEIIENNFKYKILGGNASVKYLEKIRCDIEKQLPVYMVPSYFIIMEEIPLSINGKVERRSLPLPEKGIKNLKDNYVAPRNEIERK